MMEKLRWAPKLRPEKIQRLYKSEAAGLVDEKLLNDVAYGFYARCRSVVMVTEGRGFCPDCQNEFKVGVPCSQCGRVIGSDEFITSYRHLDLYGGTGIDYFRSYIDLFPTVSDDREKMMLIDQLIHAFHRGVVQQANRSIANNLIEGTHQQVTELLDCLTFGKDDQGGGYKKEWTQKHDVMVLLRRGRERTGD